MNDQRLLDLHFSQLTKAWNKSKNNKYSDRQKKSYQKKLEQLYDKLAEEDFSTLTDPNQIAARYKIITFFFKSLEFLDYSVINLIPFEIVQCLEIALKEWNTKKENYIIVTSFSNYMNHFSFDSLIALNDSYHKLIEAVYSIKFESKLIQINLPRFLSRDYLANVVLYHELGHFIDRKNNISLNGYRMIMDDLANNKLDETQMKQLVKYFPHFLSHTQMIIDNYNAGKIHPEIQYHIAEYFSDLFASQYIDECSSYYLEYITQKSPNKTTKHPSTTNRVEMVSSFINSEYHYVLKLIMDATTAMTGNELKVRYKSFESEDFINLIPVEIKSEEELHYLFVYGWKMWLNEYSKFKPHNGMSWDLKPSKVYEIINNLIEKSIGNYIVKSHWDKVQQNVSA